LALELPVHTGAGVCVAVGWDFDVGGAGAHIPWIEDASGQIYKLSSGATTGTWIPLPGAGHDIAAGINQLYVVGLDSVFGGFGVYLRDKQAARASGNTLDIDTFVHFGGSPGAVRLTALDDRAWLVDSGGNIYRRARKY
jgi:hypothetical protein